MGVPTYRPPLVPVSFVQVAGRDRGPILADPIRDDGDPGPARGRRCGVRGRRPMEAAALLPGRCRRVDGRRGPPRVPRGSLVGRADGCQHPRQDRRPGTGRRELPRPHLHEPVLDPQGRVVSLRADVPARRDGLRRRRDLAAGRRPVPHDDDDRQRGAVLDHLEEWLQTEWPDLRVRCTSVTEQWSTVAVVGPRARDVVAALAPDLDVANEAFPFMTWRDAVIAGVAGRVFRISFSGELAFELNVPTPHGRPCGTRSSPPGSRTASPPTARRRCTSCGPRRATRSSARRPTARSPRRTSGWRRCLDAEGVDRPALAWSARRQPPGPQAARRAAAGRSGGRAAGRGPAGRAGCGPRGAAGPDARPRHVVLSERCARPVVRPGAGQGRA